MGTVVSLLPKPKQDDPHIAGLAHCIACGHGWTSVAPIGSVWLECPECKTEKGLMKFPCVRETPAWVCNCGNQLFYATPDGFYCPNCGNWQNGF